MDDDWASDTDKDFADDFAVPEVSVPEPPPKPAPAAPPVNAWTAPNQSGDIRSASRLRQAPPARRTLDSRDSRDSRDPRDARDLRDPRDSRPPPRQASADPRAAGLPPQRHAPGFSAPRNGDVEISLHVANLPHDADERAVASIFQAAFVPPNDVRIVRNSANDVGKSAYISVRSEANRDAALALNGRDVKGNTLQVSVDRHGPPGRDRDRDRGGYGFARERRNEGGVSGTGRETGWSSGGWVDRSGGGGYEAERRGDGRSSGRGGWNEGRDGRDGRDNRDGREGRDGRDGRRDGEREQRADPSIPTGPTPAGRKKLQLKPRTKPPPVLEIDKRAIDGVTGGGAVSSAAPVMGEVRSGERPMTGGSGARTGGDGLRNGRGGLQSGGEELREGPGAKREGLDAMKGGGVNKGKGTYMTADAKREEEARRPKLLNAFAALDVKEDDG